MAIKSIKPHPHRSHKPVRLSESSRHIEIENSFEINLAYQRLFLGPFVEENKLITLDNPSCNSLYFDDPDQGYPIWRNVGRSLRYRPGGTARGSNSQDNEYYPDQFCSKSVDRELQESINRSRHRQSERDGGTITIGVRNENEIERNQPLDEDARVLSLDALPKGIQFELVQVLGRKKAGSLCIQPIFLTKAHRTLVPCFVDGARRLKPYRQATGEMFRKQTFSKLEAGIDRLTLFRPPKNIRIMDIFGELKEGSKGMLLEGPKARLLELEAKAEHSGTRHWPLFERSYRKLVRECLGLPEKYEVPDATITSTGSKARLGYEWLRGQDLSYGGGRRSIVFMPDILRP